MARIQVLAQSVCMLLWLALSAHSQPPPPNSDMFLVMRELLPHKEVFDLLDHKSVREEIGLNDVDADSIEDNVRKTFEALMKLRDADGGKRLPPNELKQKVRETIAPFNMKSYELVEKNAQFDRLLGLYVQARGYRALLNDQVAKKIGLEGEALEKYRDSRNETWDRLMEETNDAIKRLFRNTPPGERPQRSEISDLYRQAEKKLEDKLSCSLSDEQKVAFENLKGKKFEAMPEQPFPFPGRGRGPGGSKGKGPGDKGPGGERGSGERGPDKAGPDGKPPHDRKAECDRCSDHSNCQALKFGYSNRSRHTVRFF